MNVTLIGMGSGQPENLTLQGLAALRQADLILLGPGSLYTSVIPNLLVDGIVKAIRRLRHLTPLPGNQQSGNDRRSDMVDQHRDDRDQLQCASAESFLRHLPHRPFLPMKKRGDQAVSSISSSCMPS